MHILGTYKIWRFCETSGWVEELCGVEGGAQ